MPDYEEQAVSALRAGTASVTITPSGQVELAGYAFREGPSEGVHDDLWCRALTLDAGATRLALVTLDLLGVDFPLDAAIRRAVQDVGGVASDHVLLNCSHTHAGPAVATGLRGLGVPRDAYVAALPKRIAEAVQAAGEDLRPVTAAYGKVLARAGINRRQAASDGSISLGRNPEGLTDDWVHTLRVDGGEETPFAVVFHHACHGTALKQDNRMISAEWMGAACGRIGERLQNRATAMFLQGCCGQINPDVADGSFEAMERLGTEMGEAVLLALKRAEPIRGTPLSARLEQVNLPTQDPPPPEVARAHLKQQQEDLLAAQREGVHSYSLRAVETQVAYSEMVFDLAERGVKDLEIPFTIQAMQIGELALLALSGEVFFEFAQEIEERSPFRTTLVLGNSNGCTGYVPTAQAFAEGGYETDESFRWYGTLPLAPQAGEIMVDGAVRLLRELQETSTEPEGQSG